ncbi:MAG: hypothetical protein GF334_02410 [Candidatus Altiarchaeales archaeon]|nr:hypothetical protein [Candidatus Altiarchaeales archaeon]
MVKRVSNWKKKNLFTLYAPDNFEAREIGKSVAYTPAELEGRTVRASLADLTGDRGKQHMKLVFEVTDVKKDKAETRLKKFYIPGSYLNYKVRKGNTKVDYINDLDIKDAVLRVKLMVLSRWYMSQSQKKEVSKIVRESLNSHKNNTAEDFMQMTLFGKLGTEIYKKTRKVIPITRVEVHHVDVKKRK